MDAEKTRGYIREVRVGVVAIVAAALTVMGLHLYSDHQTWHVLLNSIQQQQQQAAQQAQQPQQPSAPK
jgi:hypothetical protein